MDDPLSMQTDLGVAVVLAAASQIHGSRAWDEDSIFESAVFECLLKCVATNQDHRKAIIRSLARELLCMQGEVSSRLLMPLMGGGLPVFSTRL